MKQIYIDIRNKLLAIPKRPFKPSIKFTGTGVNDLTFSGVYLENQLTYSFTVEVTDTAIGGDTVKIYDSRPDSLVENIILTGGSQPYAFGLYFKAAAPQGHTIGDKWEFKIVSEPLLQYVQMYNNQIFDEESGQLYDYPKPAVLIEFESPTIIQQLGNGSQLYDELLVKLHIVDNFMNYTGDDGIEELNLEIFDRRDRVFTSVQGFEPTNCAAMVRVNEQQDYDHTQIYHYTQTYKTNYVDTLMDRPVNGQIINPPLDATITTILEKDNGS